VKFVLDVHCHTFASGHAYSSITENAAHAASIGLTHIGIADHGPAMPGGPHFYYFGNMQIVPDYIHGVRVLKGAEVNIINHVGAVDLEDSYLERLDFTIASLHRGVVPPTHAADHTFATIRAMENRWVSILGHPADGFFDIDIEAVVAAAAQTHTIIEINNQTLNPISFRYSGDEPQRRLIQFCKEYQVPMVVSSDSHYHTQVGEVTWAMALIKEADIPESQILNTDPALFFAAINRKRELKLEE